MGIPARNDSVACAVWSSNAKVTAIKWYRDKCGRFKDNAVDTNAGGNFTPGQVYKPSLAYSLRLGVKPDGSKSVKLVLEESDTQASMLLIAAAPAVVIIKANEPRAAAPGLPIMPAITRRDGDQAASSEANIQAAVLASGVDIYCNQRNRCSGPVESETDRRCRCLGTRTSIYVTNHNVYCSVGCQIAGDEAFAGIHAAVTLETRQVAQLDGNQPSASSGGFAPPSGVIPPEESSKPGLRSHAKTGKEALHTTTSQGIDANVFIPTTTILETETISSLITSIADYILKITGEFGKATPAEKLDQDTKNTRCKELRRFPKEQEERAPYAALSNILHTLALFFLRNRN